MSVYVQKMAAGIDENTQAATEANTIYKFNFTLVLHRATSSRHGNIAMNAATRRTIAVYAVTRHNGTIGANFLEIHHQ